MKNRYNIICVLLAGIVLLSGCHEVTTEGVTNVTYYATIDINGEAIAVVPNGTPYVDAGATAIMQGEDVSGQITTTSTVDVNTSGVYTVNYSVTNPDGFKANASRTVIVYTAPGSAALITGDISGTYISDVSRYRTDNSTTSTYTGLKPITIQKVSTGLFNVSDLLGGFYGIQVYPDHAPDSQAIGHILVFDDGTVQIVDGSINIFADQIEAFGPCTYDIGSSTLVLKAIMSAAAYLEFTSTLVKQ